MFCLFISATCNRMLFVCMLLFIISCILQKLKILMVCQHSSILSMVVIKLLMQVIVYCVWRERNSRIFKQVATTEAGVIVIVDRLIRDRLLSIPPSKARISFFAAAILLPHFSSFLVYSAFRLLFVFPFIFVISGSPQLCKTEKLGMNFNIYTQKNNKLGLTFQLRRNYVTSRNDH